MASLGLLTNRETWTQAQGVIFFMAILTFLQFCWIGQPLCGLQRPLQTTGFFLLINKLPVLAQASVSKETHIMFKREGSLSHPF